MPVDDAPVHPMTIGSERYDACQAKVRRPHYYVLQRHYFPDGRFELRNTLVPDNSSTQCRYTQWATDPKCKGCKQ